MTSASAFCRTALLTVIASAAMAADYRAHPMWGSEGLWGFWEFGFDYVPKHEWKIVSAPAAAGPAWGAARICDDDADTFYDVKDADAYEIVIDLGHSQELGAFTILTMGRPNENVDSVMGTYQLFVGDTAQPGGAAVASGDFAGEPGHETVVPFAHPATGRYVKLRATPRPGAADHLNASKELCLPEFSLVTPAALAAHLAAQQRAPGEHKAAWDGRDTPENLLAFSKEFLDLIYSDNERMAVAMWGRGKLDATAKLRDEGKFVEALRGFRDYYFDKLRRPQEYGLNASDVDPSGRGVSGMGEFPQSPMPKEMDDNAKHLQIELADDLMKGLLRIGGDQKVPIGEPGGVAWLTPAPPYGQRAGSRGPYRELTLGEGLRPLWIAYMLTKKEPYLERWLAYMDDWAVNCTWLGDIQPCVNDDNQLYPVVNTIRMFGGIAQSLPEDSEVVKPQVFARIMRKLAMESPLNFTVYFRSNCNAWTPGGNQLLLAVLLDEFKASRVYFRESLRRNIEDINAIQMLRDGTDPHQWFGYNAVVLSNAAVFRLMNPREGVFWFDRPSWERRPHDPIWQVEEREQLEQRCRWVMRWAAPNGDFPNITKFGASQKTKTLENTGRLPTLMNDPISARLYSLFYGDDRGPRPAFTSDAFPYGGFFISRTGWGENQGYGAMFCSPHPGLNSAGKNNVFGLNAYGMDVLSDDIAHNYVRNTSPISVDGMRQNIDFYVPRAGWPTGHRGEMIPTWSDPPAWRWHASEQFNVMEGVYGGVYSNDYAKRDERVDDVRHQRLALFARHAGLWIITDRMLTAKKHAYEQLWWLPLRKPERGFGGFDHAGIVIDPAAKSLKTRRTATDKHDCDNPGHTTVIGNVNLSLYQFTDAAVTYANNETKSGEEVYDWERFAVSWQGEGDQQVVTALYPRKPTPEKAAPDGTENDLKSIAPLSGPKGTAGFDAVTPEGIHVTYLAAKAAGEPLEIAGIKIIGEALLVTRDPAEQVTRGMAFGCKEMTVKGAKVAVGQSDFEFTIPAAAAATQVIAINRPMAPLKILPESDAFAGSQEITFVSDVPDALMTYTLDGTEPTPQSTLYKGPFKLERSAVVKGRAYRKGTTANPFDMSGTQATPVTVAPYTRTPWYEADTANPQTPGLNYAYCEGYWKDLWLTPARVAPKKQGVSPTLFDMGLIPADNRPLSAAVVPREKAYSFTYTGWLRIPADGTYTIHAPREFVHPDQIAGYELQVYLGHASNPDGNQASGFARDGALSFWYPSTRLHGLGTWSVPLKQGFHEFKVVYIDFRMDAIRRMNHKVDDAKLRDPVWTGDKPDLEISGPGLERQPIPTAWMFK